MKLLFCFLLLVIYCAITVIAIPYTFNHVSAWLSIFLCCPALLIIAMYLLKFIAKTIVKEYEKEH